MNDTSLNGKGATALEEKPLDVQTPVTPVPPTEKEDKSPNEDIVKSETEKEIAAPPEAPRKKKPMGLILAIVGVGAIAAGGHFGYQYWQYASTHVETDNATVVGHIHPISTRIDGTVTEVTVNDNQIVKPGQLLVKLDPRDYQIKVQQAQAAIETARQQAQAAEASISLADRTAEANTTKAQGDISGALAGISTAQAAVEEAKTGVPAAEAAVAEAETGVPAAEAAVAEAEAGIPQAQAAVREAEAGIPQAQAAVREAEAGVVAARETRQGAIANLEKAEADYNRYQSLYESGAIPGQQLDSAKAAYEVARSQKNAAEQAIQQAEAKVAQAKEGEIAAQAKVAQAKEGVARAQAHVAQATEGVAKAQAQVAQAKENVVRAQAQVAQATEGVASARAKLASSQGGLQQATASGKQTEVNRSQYQAAQSAIAQADVALKNAQLQLSYTNITAPAAGRIGRRSVEVGQRVQPGTPLMAIVSDDVWVIANFKETQLEQMKPGQKVEIKLDAFGHHAFEGRVNSFSPASGSQFALLPPDNATGNFTKVVQRIPVKVVFDPESIKGYESRITPGMSAVVNVELKPSNPAK